MGKFHKARCPEQIVYYLKPFKQLSATHYCKGATYCERSFGWLRLIGCQETYISTSSARDCNTQYNLKIGWPCYGWAQSCYLKNTSSISGHHLEISSLNPLVALGHVFMEQTLSLRLIIEAITKLSGWFTPLLEKSTEADLNQTKQQWQEKTCKRSKNSAQRRQGFVWLRTLLTRNQENER